MPEQYEPHPDNGYKPSNQPFQDPHSDNTQSESTNQDRDKIISYPCFSAKETITYKAMCYDREATLLPNKKEILTERSRTYVPSGRQDWEHDLHFIEFVMT